MLQRLPIALAQVKAGHASKNLLNEIIQIICFLCRTKEITKKGYNNIINSMELWSRIDSIFLNSGNRNSEETACPHRLLANLSDKIN